MLFRTGTRSIILYLLAIHSGSMLSPLVHTSAYLIKLPSRFPHHHLRALSNGKLPRGVVQLRSRKLALQEEIYKAYEEEETDGILRIAASTSPLVSTDDIVAASVEASRGVKGIAASILNSWIGSCRLSEDKVTSIQRVREILHVFEAADDTRVVRPDIMTYALAFATLAQDPASSHLADYVLYRATRLSKGLSSSKRRKSLAAARSKPPSSFSESEDELKKILGKDFEVLNETDEYAIINKPSGVSCFHKKTTTAGKYRKGKSNDLGADISLEDALLSCNIPLSTLNPECLGLVHRLDRGSSGCLVMAKTDKMHALLVSEFFLRRTEKKYLAIVSPAPDKSLPDAGEITAPVDDRPAKSRYRIIERYDDAAALLEWEIYTGRKHQIRVHAAEVLATPLLMDTYYNKTKIPELEKYTPRGKQKFPLHSERLAIPEYGIKAKAKVPRWWNKTISILKGND